MHPQWLILVKRSVSTYTACRVCVFALHLRTQLQGARVLKRQNFHHADGWFQHFAHEAEAHVSYVRDKSQ